MLKHGVPRHATRHVPAFPPARPFAYPSCRPARAPPNQKAGMARHGSAWQKTPRRGPRAAVGAKGQGGRQGAIEHAGLLVSFPLFACVTSRALARSPCAPLVSLSCRSPCAEALLRSHGMGFAQLLAVSDEELKHLGILKGSRLKLLASRNKWALCHGAAAAAAAKPTQPAAREQQQSHKSQGASAQDDTAGQKRHPQTKATS